ncbi:MAG: hypothetical protein Kow00127_21880 [Bacteroidales bacterium]
MSVPVRVVPLPKEITPSSECLFLKAPVKVWSSDSVLNSLTDLVMSDLHSLFGIHAEQAYGRKNRAGIVISIDSTLGENQYEISVRRSVEIRGGSYNALAMARSTLLQIAFASEGQLAVPVTRITDFPDVSYRGLMIDLARQWHPVETIEQLINLAAWYKIGFLHLHFSDYQSYTLPSKVLPGLPTPDRHYSFDELSHLEKYADIRGVTIIPEIDIPGHSSPFVRSYPEIFAIGAVDENPWIINMGREEVYQKLESLIAEISGIFRSSPYFHIGGDEAIFYKVDEDPDVQNYCSQHNINSNPHELYRHFLVRMNQIVRKQGKQMCVWEGFRPDGEIPIPRDILVFAYETNRYLPGDLVKDGYNVVNASWKPLYVVNQKKWSPAAIYGWNLWRWENWYPKVPSFHPIQLSRTPSVIGAQMCAWEQSAGTEIPSLRKRLPALAERLWDTTAVDFSGFSIRLNHTDSLVSQLINDSRQDTVADDYNFSAPETE